MRATTEEMGLESSTYPAVCSATVQPSFSRAHEETPRAAMHLIVSKRRKCTTDSENLVSTARRCLAE
jgi:hypothetical protein